VQPGDTIIVKPGARIPVDGTVLEGLTAIDESMLTGESMPADKQPGDAVFAASLNTNGSVTFRAEKVGADTALAHIIQLVEDAQSAKAPINRLADVVAGYFVPIVCAIALVVGIAWYLATTVGGFPLPAGKTAAEFSLLISISVLVIACPCALGLATPTAIMVGTGKGAELGILIKSGEGLELAHTINTVILDKTGTVTEGRPSVVDVIPIASARLEDALLARNEDTDAATRDKIVRAQKDELDHALFELVGNDAIMSDMVGAQTDRLLALAASVEKNSEHPLGQALVGEAAKRSLALSKTSSFQSLTGRGVVAKIDGQKVLAGNRKLMDENGVAMEHFEGIASMFATQGKTPLYLAIAGAPAGVITVADKIKATSLDAIKRLRSMGIEVCLLTGDNQQTASAIAGMLDIDNVRAEVLPEDKAREIVKQQDRGRKVAMVGDGINDAPALAQADLGIAIGSGTDVAIESADIVLMHSDLMDVPRAIDLSRKTIRNIKQNLFWAFGYNVVGIPIAAGLLYLFGGPLLNPIIAAACMSLSSVSVLTNALRLRRYHFE
ncbi:MAG: copper-translocating P-type ATPase, partial [Coriobacteriales bacterium]|jgi:Cu+-exporting ATPase|nr:copper-translocating P-type ATPase [Coriobacteriales bacterium]